MSSRQPFVTVLTPCYNMAEFLGECIESVLRQTYDNFEYLAQSYNRPSARSAAHSPLLKLSSLHK
jgi:GT2 family glycosyltransferase